MKAVIAIIPPDRLLSVKSELANIEVFRLSVMDVQGFNSNTSPTSQAKARESELMLTRRVQLFIGVNDNFLEPTIEAIQRGANDENGNSTIEGKIFVLPLLDCVRIRTGERGPEAI